MKSSPKDPVLAVPYYSAYTPSDPALVHLHQYITQRIAARRHKNRDDYDLYPYTDPIIPHYRFTNIFREYDKVSMCIIRALQVAHRDHIGADVLFANMVAWRLLNTAHMITVQPHLGDPNASGWKDDNQNFTTAFNTIGAKHKIKTLVGTSSDTYPSTMAVYDMVDEYVRYPRLYTKTLIKAKNPKEFCKMMERIPGIGPFLAYQIFVDCTYAYAFTSNTILKFPWSENCFTVAGPGCKRGLRVVFPNAYPDGQKKGISVPENRLSWLLHHFPLECQRLNLPWEPEHLFAERDQSDQRLNIMAWENIMCEFQKYVRLLEGGGGRTRRYNG